MAHDVFISYSRKDNRIADEICKAFANNDISYWIDRGEITSGDEFHAKIVRAIRDSKITVFVSSVNSNMSEYTIKEIVIAFKNKKHIIPFCIDEQPFADSIEFYLCDLNRVSYHLEKEFSIQKLVDDISKLLNKTKRIIINNVSENVAERFLNQKEDTVAEQIAKPFLMPIEDVFSITGRGTVVTGRIETGIIKTGDEIQTIGLNSNNEKAIVTGVEMFRKIIDEGQAGDNVGLLLRGIGEDEIKRGMAICHTGQYKAYARFEADIYFLKVEEGGRHTPIHNEYCSQFYIHTSDIAGKITLPKGVERVMPGDELMVYVALKYPVACRVGLFFAIREGGRTIGVGQIIELID